MLCLMLLLISSYFSCSDRWETGHDRLDPKKKVSRHVLDTLQWAQREFSELPDSTELKFSSRRMTEELYRRQVSSLAKWSRMATRDWTRYMTWLSSYSGRIKSHWPCTDLQGLQDLHSHIYKHTVEGFCIERDRLAINRTLCSDWRIVLTTRAIAVSINSVHIISVMYFIAVPCQIPCFCQMIYW